MRDLFLIVLLLGTLSAFFVGYWPSIRDRNSFCNDSSWTPLYSTVTTEQLERVEGKHLSIVAAFNTNIDAIVYVSPEMLEGFIDTYGISAGAESSIRNISDFVRGLLFSYQNGIAAEWLVESTDVYEWLLSAVHPDHYQMGGQAGIMSNLLSLMNASTIFCHCASLPDMQSRLFSEVPNILSVDGNGKWKPAHSISNRDGEAALIHWIFEFGETTGNHRYRCPRPNRFIVTYDPLNSNLTVDSNFHEGIVEGIPLSGGSIDLVILSGFQMLRVQKGGLRRLHEAALLVREWKGAHPLATFHFEFASTQDETILRSISSLLLPLMESVGLNERELLDISRALNFDGDYGSSDPSVSELLELLLNFFKISSVPRIQLHMHGMYVTVIKNGFSIPERVRAGMLTAAIIAANKASGDSQLLSLNNAFRSGSLHLSSYDQIKKLLVSKYNVECKDDGIFRMESMTIVAIPTIIVRKPGSLVGMGDAISSFSLAAAAL